MAEENSSNKDELATERIFRYLIITIIILFIIIGVLSINVYNALHPNSTLDQTAISTHDIEFAEYDVNTATDTDNGTISVEVWSTIPRYIRVNIKPDYENGATPATQSVIDNFKYNTDDWVYHPENEVDRSWWYYKGTVSGRTPQLITLASSVTFPDTKAEGNKEMPVIATVQIAPAFNPNTGVYMTEDEAWDWLESHPAD